MHYYSSMPCKPIWRDSDYFGVSLSDKINTERERQVEKFGYQFLPDSHWLAVLMEEIGEFADEALAGDSEQRYMECVQVAAVAVSILESVALSNESALETNSKCDLGEHLLASRNAGNLWLMLLSELGKIARATLDLDTEQRELKQAGHTAKTLVEELVLATQIIKESQNAV